jgi:outer membrane protein OmpA-like peptidoglycan-associated protein
MRKIMFLLLCIVAHGAIAEVVPLTNIVSVSFNNGSAVFRPGVVAQELLASAPDAAMVTINGRTSTNKPSAKDEALALARAVAARKYLIKQGVSPLKIMINYVSAADFLTENVTPEGQYINQRVDIEMIFIPMY